jgi:hypothetical protein
MNGSNVPIIVDPSGWLYPISINFLCGFSEMAAELAGSGRQDETDPVLFPSDRDFKSADLGSSAFWISAIYDEGASHQWAKNIFSRPQSNEPILLLDRSNFCFKFLCLRAADEYQ